MLEDVSQLSREGIETIQSEMQELIPEFLDSLLPLIFRLQKDKLLEFLEVEGENSEEVEELLRNIITLNEERDENIEGISSQILHVIDRE